MEVQEEKKGWDVEKDWEVGKKDREIDGDKDYSEGAEVGDLDDDDDDDDDSEDGELVDLPKELRKLKNQTFDFQDDLEAELVKRGFPDLPVVIDPKSKKPRLRMTTGAHDKITGLFRDDFNLLWGKNTWAKAEENTNVFIEALPKRKMTRRKPDIAFWGKDKCELTPRGVLVPKDLANPPQIHATREQVERVNPDVVFQFSRGNSKGYEVQAIDDLMNRAVVSYTPHQPNNEAPKLGFLVKLRFKTKKRTRDNRKVLSKVDVYRIPRGATVEDAKANRKGARHATYAPGGQDVEMEITAQDLCIEGYQGAPGTPYKISAKEIFESLS